MEVRIIIRGAQCTQVKEGASITLNLPELGPEETAMLRNLFPNTERQIHKLLMTEAVIERMDA